MSVVSPSGPLSEPLDRLREQLCNCDTWQDWTKGEEESGTYAIALTHTFLVGVDGDDDVAIRPWAWIGWGEDWKTAKHSGDHPGVFRTEGGLLVQFLAAVPAAYVDDPADPWVWLMNKVGAITDELKALNGGSGYLHITGIELLDVDRADKTQRKNEGDWVQALLGVKWG